MQRNLFLLFCISFYFLSNAQGLRSDYLRQFGGKWDDEGVVVKTDADGNLYAAGYFENYADFDPDTSIFDLISFDYILLDIYLAKYDKTGKLLWAFSIGESYGEHVGSIAIDTSGVYITGAFSGVCDFDPGTGKVELRSYGSNYDFFVAKYSTSGQFIWVKEIGNDFNNEYGRSLALDSAGNIFVAGLFSATTDFDPGTGTFNLSPAGDPDAFVLKLDKTGKFIWAKNFGDDVYSIALDRKANVYITGKFTSPSTGSDFDPGKGVYLLKSRLIYSTYVLKLNSSGDFEWAFSLGNTKDGEGRGIAVDTSGNVYCIGYFTEIVDFDPGSDSFKLDASTRISSFIAKYSSSGNFIWAKRIGGASTTLSKSIYVDGKGNVYTTGAFNETTDFDPGMDKHTLTSYGSGDIYMLKLDSSGNYLWAVQMGGKSDESANFITKDKTGGIYVTGWFKGTADMAPYSKAHNLTSYGPKDIFLHKFTEVTCDTNTNFISRSGCNHYISPSGRYKWSNSGTYKDTVINKYGCDSFLNIKLTIKSSSSNSNLNVTACNSYKSPSKRFVWSSSGIFKDTIPNSVGCDSLITINLTIIKSTSSTISPSVCNNYISPSKKYTWSISGVYKDTLLNKAGCDSILSINLKINKNSSYTISPSRCNIYLSPSKKFVWTTSGTYRDTLKTSAGCDSFMTIKLVITKVDVSVTNKSPILTANANAPSYQWLDCNTGFSIIIGALQKSFTASHNGSYAVRIIQNGCTDTSECYQVSNATIRTKSRYIPILFYPNPSSGVVHFETGGMKPLMVNVFNSFGEEIMGSDLYDSKFDLIIPGSSGVYFVCISFSGDKSIFIKLVKY